MNTDECKTEDGGLCKFPFYYKGEYKDGCTMEDSEQYWCPTKISSDSSDEWKEWGYCTSSCVINYNDAT